MKFLGSELAKHLVRAAVLLLVGAVGYIVHLVQMLGK